jgi:16S rRNA processing protein RimM
VTGDSSLIELGRLGRPHGLDGELPLVPCTLTALELHAVRSFLWRGRDGSTRALTLTTARAVQRHMLVRFDEVTNREGAATLTNGRLFAEEERLPDPGPGVAYNFQLIGLDVFTEEGQRIGRLAEIWPTPAHPVLVVRGEGEVLVPAIPEFVRAVSLEEGRVTVRLLPGMEEAKESPSS